MLEYLGSLSIEESHKDPVLSTILYNRQRYTHTTITTEGTVASNVSVRYYLPELVVSIAVDYLSLYAVTTEGNLYISVGGEQVRKAAIPEPVVMVTKVNGCVFAFTADGVVYYRVVGKEGWFLINVERRIVNVIGDIYYTYLSCSDGRWYSFSPTAVALMQ